MSTEGFGQTAKTTKRGQLSKDITVESKTARQNRIKEERRQSLYNNHPKDNRKCRGKILTSKDLAELKAQETLREFISEGEWRRYVTNGFIMVKSQKYQNRTYQIFRDERITVWITGKIAAKLCIHTHNSCPPTDHVINMKTLAEFDEDAIWAGSNVFPSPGFEYLNPKRDTIIQVDNNNGLIGALFNEVYDYIVTHQNLYAIAG